MVLILIKLFLSPEAEPMEGFDFFRFTILIVLFSFFVTSVVVGGFKRRASCWALVVETLSVTITGSVATAVLSPAAIAAAAEILFQNFKVPLENCRNLT